MPAAEWKTLLIHRLGTYVVILPRNLIPRDSYRPGLFSMGARTRLLQEFLVRYGHRVLGFIRRPLVRIQFCTHFCQKVLSSTKMVNFKLHECFWKIVCTWQVRGFLSSWKYLGVSITYSIFPKSESDLL